MSRRKKRPKMHTTAKPTGTDVFAELGLNAAEFDIASGGGKCVISKQRLIWIHVTHLPTGRKASGKIGSTKKGGDRPYRELLRWLLGKIR